MSRTNSPDPAPFANSLTASPRSLHSTTSSTRARMQGRQLFVEDSEPTNISSETVHIMMPELSRRPSEDQRLGYDGDEELKDASDWQPRHGDDNLTDWTLKTRPPKLTLADNEPIKNVRLSTGSAESHPPPSSPSSPDPPKPAIVPSLSLLFSFNTRSTNLCIVLPGVVFSVASGLVPPYMTDLIGKAFAAFTTYTVNTVDPALSSDALASARSTLLHSMRGYTIQFAVLAALTFVFGTVATALWVIHGERVARSLRMEVYRGVAKRDLAWFDLGMGAEEGMGADDDEAQSGAGAGGLMGRFTK